MAISKGCKADNFESHNSLKLTNILDLCSNFVECESFLESKSPDIHALFETKLDDSIGSGNCSEGLSSFNLKGFCCSYAWSCCFCEERTSFCTGLISRELCRFLHMFFDWHYFTQCLTSFPSINHPFDAQFLIPFHLT